MRAADKNDADSGLSRALRLRALELGFAEFGVARVEEIEDMQHYDAWLQKGYHADMDYLQRHQEKKNDPELIVPGARSIIVCSYLYNSRAPRSTDSHEDDQGWISRYAWGDDYHDTVKKMIRSLYEYLCELVPGAAGRYYVDTGPVLERAWAQQAGLGWLGKNTCLIHPVLGSYTFIAVIITDVALQADQPSPDRCGSCTRCIDACPTGALIEANVLDANRCISYLAIENREEIPTRFREKMGRHVFGCDICQDVCPWNRKAPVSIAPEVQPRPEAVNPSLADLLALDEDGFRQRFRKSPVKRTKFRGFMRNVLVAAGNSGVTKLRSYIARFLDHEDELLRTHARWAYEKASGTQKKEDAA